MNPLISLLKQTNKGQWYPSVDIMLMVGYQMKLAGFDWRTNEELAEIFTIFWKAGVIEHVEDDGQYDPTTVRFKQELYDALPV